MPLLSIWQSNPSAINQFTIEQVIKAAGDGTLKDNSDCSSELRSYLSQAQSKKLEAYIESCLTANFDKSGMVLQDLINELGRRLDYQVTNGQYQGTTNSIGQDGIWSSPEGQSIVIEVKTTDAYRVSLDKIAAYREKLLAGGKIAPPSSILVVVGRQDTGELEAQIRGSRHAWDVRLISADALIRLVKLKEDSEGQETGKKIRSLLMPKEYTRLDGMIDVMFTTAKDVESATEADSGAKDPITDDAKEIGKIKGEWKFTDSAIIQYKRDDIIAALGKREGAALIKKSRALYWNSGHDVRAACTVSKRYQRKGGPPYWYAYHPQWDEFLGDAKRSFLVLGCVDRNEAFALPLPDIRAVLDQLNITQRDDGHAYWHLHLSEPKSGELALLLPKSRRKLSLNQYRLKI
jgi:hypothetical protein